MPKPIAAPLPAEPGIYWLKVANRSHTGSGWGWDTPSVSEWFLAIVELVGHDGEIIDPLTGYNIMAYMGSDSIGHWDNDWDGVVVAVGPKVTEPED